MDDASYTQVEADFFEVRILAKVFGKDFVGASDHEIAHSIEYVSKHVSKAAKNFRTTLANRTVPSGEAKIRKLEELVPEAGYEPYEIALDGGFFNPYVVRIYSGTYEDATEVVTMGIERLYTATSNIGSPVRALESEHFSLIDWIVEVALKKGVLPDPAWVGL